MCGRIAFNFKWREIWELIELGHMPERFARQLEPQTNVAPTMLAPFVRSTPDDGTTIDVGRWGLIPPWWREPKPPTLTFNARAETVGEKPMFREAFKHRRCLVPVSWYYEWVSKVPHRIFRADGRPLLLAGLWEPSVGDNTTPSFTIITTDAHELPQLHPRQPVVIEQDSALTWLAPLEDGERPDTLLDAMIDFAPEGILTHELADPELLKRRTAS